MRGNMKKIIWVFVIVLNGCASMIGGVGESDVIKQVSFDKDCPKEQVKILKKITDMGSGSYKVQACGKTYDYRHAGTVVFEKGKGPAGT